MSDDAMAAESSKFSRYRAARKAEGLKLLRMWTPDPKSPGFRADINRQIATLYGAPEEREALNFIEAAGDWSAGEP